MICPVCKSDMIVVERNRIELDHCGTCGGSWFDSGEIELLLAGFGVRECSAFLGDLLGGVEPKTSEKARRCPVCSQKMRKSNIGERPHVLIDACRRGDGLWFDGGELDGFLTQLAGTPMVGPECDRKIADFLGDTLRVRRTQVPGHNE
jgi:Zn-finger nucleic acid-binding protein